MGRLAGRALPQNAGDGIGLLVLDDRGLILKLDVGEHDVVELAAFRAAVVPPLLRPLQEQILNGAVSLDSGGGNGHGLGVVERGLTGFRQFPGVALGAGACRPPVQLVAHDIADRGRGQGRGAIGAAHGQHTAGERLLENGVAALPALGVCHLCPEGLAVPHHWGDTELGKLLGVVDGGVDVENAAWVLVDDVADTVQLKFRFAHLGGGNHDQQFHLWIGEGVHRLFQIGRPGRAPGPRFRRALRGEAALFVGPLGDGDVLGRRKGGDSSGDGGVQLFGIVTVRPHRLPSISAAPAPTEHRRRGHT